MTSLEITQKAYDCFLKGDVAGLVALYAEGATFTPQMGLEGKSPPVTPKGTFSPSEMPGFFAALAQEIDFTTWENRQFVVDGNTVIALGYYAGKNKRTGKSFGCEFAHVATLANGKFTSFKEFTDTAQVLAAAAA
jgi:uncharacterized protein